MKSRSHNRRQKPVSDRGGGAGARGPAGAQGGRALEPRQVLADLPGRHLLVVAIPLLALDADEVVDVVLIACPPESLAQHLVLLELVGGLEQVGRQRLKAAPPQ